MKLKYLFVFSLFLSSLINAMPQYTGHAEVSLIKTDNYQDQNKIHLGIRMDMDEGWHTYWLNPGDSGGAIEVEWNISNGNSISQVMYPAPHKIPYPPLMTFGYEDFVIFPLELFVNDVNDDINIDATIKFLICSDVCIPENATITTSLGKIKTDKELNKWINKVPKINLPNIVMHNNENIEIRFSFNEKIADIYFYPNQKDVFVYNSDQDLQREDNNWVLTVPLIDSAPNSIEGVLVINEESFIIRNNSIISSVSKKHSISTWKAIVFAFIGGLILNLMPCVFPIISLKALSFISMGGSSNTKIRLHALNFCLGVIISFISIALLIVALQKTGNIVGWGFQLQSPLIVSSLCILMLIIGLILLLDIDIGSSLTRLGVIGNNETTYVSSFNTGVLAVIVASPCTAPFMGAAIGYAILQPSAITIPIFLFLGIGFSLPYLILALFPGLISRMPKPGQWMNYLKQFFALPMFGTALWLLWVFSLQTNLNSLIVLILTMLLISFMFWLNTKDISKNIKTLSLSLILLAVISQLLSINKIESNDEVLVASQNIGLDNIETKLQTQNQAYLINFTAAWCITCQANEKLALSKPSVKKYLKDNDIQYIKIDWTNRNDEILLFLNKYERTGVPLYLYWKPGFEETKILPSILTEDLLIKSL
ncbi:MAG: protein-disulfide reductase DsbD family protein [Gammaproteobacteria bacterium]